MIVGKLNKYDIGAESETLCQSRTIKPEDSLPNLGSYSCLFNFDFFQ